MGWLDVVGLGASAASGGILGLVGSGLGAISTFFQKRQEHTFQKDSWQHEKDLLELQLKRSSAEWEAQERIVQQEGSWSALGESMSVQTEGDSYRWVNAVKSLFRPVLTTGLFIMTWFIYGSTADPALLKYIVYSVVFTACTAGTWWFADRAFAPPGMKNR